MTHLTPAQLEKLLAELEAKAGEIESASGPAAGPIWGAVHKLLLKSPVDNRQAMRIVGSRDVALLRRAIAELRGAVGPGGDGATRAAALPTEVGGPMAETTIDAEVLKEAMKAFRRRLKLVKLDHESKLSARALTGGRKADFQAILPPREFDDAVWEALVAEGKLRDAGGGFYMLPEDAAHEH